MLHELLTLERSLFIFDLETTGTNRQKDRIVEISFTQFKPDGTITEWESRINPEMEIPEGARATHGITNDTVKDAPTFREIATNLAGGFSNCDFGGKNVRFDLELLQAEFNRVQVRWSYKDANVLDAERLEQLAVPRSLSHLYEKYTGEKLVGAHGAKADVRASILVLFHQLRTHVQLPRNLAALHELQWPGRVDSEGKFRIKDRQVYCTFGKYRDQKIQAIPPDYWKYILKSDFSDEMKSIAANALKGIYPEIP